MTCGTAVSGKAWYCKACLRERARVLEKRAKVRKQEQARLAARSEREIKFVRRITPGELEDVEHWT